VIVEVKAPEAEAAPSSVESSARVGVPDVFQQTPYAVGSGAPSPVIFPFPVAPSSTIPLTGWVVTVGATGSVEKVTSAPYAVPAKLVA